MRKRTISVLTRIGCGKLKAPAILVVCLSFTLLIGLQLGSVNGQTATGITFTRTPFGYNPQSGAFTLDQQAYWAGPSYFRSGLCIAYEYFQFNVTSGQVVDGQLNSPGQNIFYVFFTPRQFQTFDDNAQNCYITFGSAQVQSFNSPTTLNWTTPEAGQYTLVFYTRTFYPGPVYFTQ